LPSSVRVGSRHPNPISSALRDSFPRYTPIPAWHRASVHGGQRLVFLLIHYLRQASRSVTHAAHTDLHDQTKRKISHVATTSQRIRFKQVEVQLKGSPPQSPAGPSTSGKGKGASSKQKANPIDNANIVDSITGNVDPGDLPLQSRRKRGKGRGAGADGSQTSQTQPGDREQATISEETSSVLEAAM
jgi:hypothetical protein